MLLLEAQAGGAAGLLGNPLTMIVLMFIIMWFFMIRPQRKQQKAIEAFRNSLSAGQHVVTSGGVYGTVKEIITENGRQVVILEIAPSVKIKIDKSSIFADMPAQQN
ncbi:MAG: preprotein translocase subunit YajC [Bacteroidaceae bacterium]|jgi:preprotein translocase subunit YajC|nr:preprotein translocase subunit YajC [Bacteroidaceae bacterium]